MEGNYDNALAKTMRGLIFGHCIYVNNVKLRFLIIPRSQHDIQ